MALKILYQRVEGTLTQDISAATTLIPIDSNSLALLQAQVNFEGGDWTYLTIFDGVYSEEIKVTGTSGAFLSVVRARSGSTARAFAAANAVLVDHVGADAITDIVVASPPSSSLTFVGSGIASATNVANVATVGVAPPNFTGSDGVGITGNWPSLSFALESSGEGCGCGGGSGGSGSGVDQVVVV